ncbi:MAG: hypothetical protein PVF65_12100 [Sphingomonadales bacterium]|jgi:hypothetical protein
MNQNLIVPKSARKKLSSDDIKKMKEEGHRIVKGVFRCQEPPGGSVTFSFKAFPGDQVEKYTFVDGKIYSIPLMVAKHINNNCSYDIHQHVLDAEGKPRIDVGRKVRRFTFQSLDFMDETPEDE